MNTKCAILTGVTVLSGILPRSQASIDLGSAADFAVLGGTAVTSAGNTVLNGNLGVVPGTSITGFCPGLVNGLTLSGGLVAQQAAADAQTAYLALTLETPSQNLSGQNLGGLSLAPGVYNFTTSAQLTGQLTLNANGNPNAQFIFQIGSSLTTASIASMVLANGAQAGNVFWQVGTSATIGSGSIIYGSILAGQSIGMGAGASLGGNALALDGAVTLNDNTITIASIPEVAPLRALVIFATVAGSSSFLGAWRRKKTARLKMMVPSLVGMEPSSATRAGPAHAQVLRQPGS